MEKKESIKNLNNLRKRVSIIFTGALILVIWIIQFWFLTFKFQNAKINDSRRVDNTIRVFEKRIKDRLNQENRRWNLRLNKNIIGKIIWNIRLNNSLILDHDFEVIKSSFSDDFDKIFQQNIKKLWKKWRIEILKIEYIYKSILLPKIWYFVKLERVSYSSWEYKKDLLNFFLILIIMWFLLFFIINKYSRLLFKPVENNINDMSNFIDNAGHELKTPLAVISWELQIMQATKSYDEALVKEWLSEVKNMNSLIDWLITLTWIKNNSTKKEIVASEIIRLVLKENSINAKEKWIKLELKILNDFKLKTNQNYFQIVFTNIISNAIRYTNKWGKVEVIIDKWKISVCDNWVWIDKSDLKKIFNRFYRCDKSRSTKWFWIWLSLVEKICNINDWKIGIKSKVWEWTIFTINF